MFLSFSQPFSKVKMRLGIGLFNLEFFVLDALIRHPTNLYFWWGSRDQAFGISWHRHHKCLGGCNVAIMSYCSGNTYKGTKYAAFLTELNNKWYALNVVNSTYMYIPRPSGKKF